MRRQIATTRQERMADLSSQVSESLSVSGHPAHQDHGPQRRARRQVRRHLRRSGRSRGPVVDDRPLAAVQHRHHRVDPARGHLPGRGDHHRRHDRSGVDRHPGRVHRTAGARCSGRWSRCCAPASTCRPRWRCSAGSSTTSTCRSTSTSRPRPRALPDGRGELRFDDVTFRYPGTETDTLSHIDLTVPPAAHVAVVGSTGSGKTTLGYLAARLYDPTGGSVLLDGVDLRELGLHDLASVVGVVSQEAYLLHASIADNLRFARAGRHRRRDRRRRPGRADPRADRLAAAGLRHRRRRARLPVLRRREAAAGHRRMILRNPPVLVLDEATSALDTRTEAAVTAALAELVRRPNDSHHRAPAVDRARRGRDRRDGPRTHR